MTRRNFPPLKKAITVLHVKNMVCNRCIRVVKEELENIGYDVNNITLGEVEIIRSRGKVDIQEIRSVLESNGFELIEDKRAKIIEKIKVAIVDLISHDHEKESMKMKYSEYLSNKLGIDYHSLSTMFSSIENITIERYIILQKIERAKELLRYGELTLSEISYKMGYSSVQHLSSQFRRITGLTPSHFRTMKQNLRKPLDQVKGQ